MVGSARWVIGIDLKPHFLSVDPRLASASALVLWSLGIYLMSNAFAFSLAMSKYNAILECLAAYWPLT